MEEKGKDICFMVEKQVRWGRGYDLLGRGYDLLIGISFKIDGVECGYGIVLSEQEIKGLPYNSPLTIIPDSNHMNQESLCQKCSEKESLEAKYPENFTVPVIRQDYSCSKCGAPLPTQKDCKAGHPGAIAP